MSNKPPQQDLLVGWRNLLDLGKVELVKFERGEDGDANDVYLYAVAHSNGKTTVEQKLTIRNTNRSIDSSWIASFSLEDIPPQSSPEKAVEKLADWMERLAAAMRSGEYQQYSGDNFRDLHRNKT